jgi:hypothetical protein
LKVTPLENGAISIAKPCPHAGLREGRVDGLIERRREGPRAYDEAGLHPHLDNQSILKECINCNQIVQQIANS